MKRRRHEQRGGIIPALFACLVIGGLAGWWFRGMTPADLVAVPSSTPVPSVLVPERAAEHREPPDVTRSVSARERETDSHASAEVATVPTIGIDPIAELRRHRLRLPVDDARVDAMAGDFTERRGGGLRGHEAVDLMAKRLTPVRAVDNGSIAKLFLSEAGGITIYQFDPSGQFCYYYAHLEKYADGLKEGQPVSAGDVIGYVGSTGNAAENAPHLHFAIFRLTDDRHWWQGTPLDPYQVFKP